MILTELYRDSSFINLIDDKLQTSKARLHIDGMTGSLPAVAIATLAQRRPTVSQLVIAPTKEEAYYLQNDLEALLKGDKEEGDKEIRRFGASTDKKTPKLLYSLDKKKNLQIS